MTASYRAFLDKAIPSPDGFWGEEARLIHWARLYSSVLDPTALEHICAPVASA